MAGKLNSSIPRPRIHTYSPSSVLSQAVVPSELHTANKIILSGEPRRSGRATKGQHTKNLDLEGPAPTPKREKKQKRPAKQTSNEPDDEGEEDSIIRCICGATEDEGGWMMISCENCNAWQHNLCMDVTEVDAELENIKYYCEQCKPEDHKELLEAMERGERPWEQRQAQRREEEKAKSKKGKKGGRKSSRPSGANDTEPSSAPKLSPAAATPIAPPAETGTKRKFSAYESANGQDISPTTTSPLNVTDTAAGAQEPPSRRSKSISEAPRRTSGAVPVTKHENIDQLPKERQAVVKALTTTFKPLISKAVKDGSYVLPKSSTLDAMSQHFGLEIEYALKSKYRTQDKDKLYSAQFRAILFNVKKNEALVKGILSGSLSPDDLSEMSTDDMASEQLQKERAAMKEEADKQATLAHEEGPRYRKTHKGEELIDDGPSKPQEEVYVAPVRRRTLDESAADVPIDTGSPPPSNELPEGYDETPNTAGTSMSPTKASPFNIQNVWQNLPPTDPSRTEAPAAIAGAAKQEDLEMPDVDDDISRLLKDEDDLTAPPDPNVVWRGEIRINGMADFRGSARYACGGDLRESMPYTDVLDSVLEIDGRLGSVKADEYVANQRWSKHNDVYGLIVEPSATAGDLQDFNTLFKYFKDKDRWGVILKRKHDIVHDMYIAPIEKGNAPLPSFVNMLVRNSIPASRPNDVMLLVLVARTKLPLPHLSTTSTPSAAAATPVGTGGASPFTPLQTQPNFSPVAPTVPTMSAQQTAAAPTPAIAIAPRPLSNLEIQMLGPHLATAPVVKQILDQLPEPMSEVQLQNLRDILDRDPLARRDIAHLNEHIQRRMTESVMTDGGAGST
jgi:SPOC domain-containing protein/transcription initiation factor TFIIS-like protein/PHD finger proteni